MAQSIARWTPHLWVAQSRFAQTNAGLWLSRGQACLIDPGVYPDEIAALARFVAGQGVMSRTIVLTHAHWDHILGPERTPGARVVAQAAFSSCVLGSEGLVWVERWEAREGIVRERPFAAPRPDVVFEDEMTLAVGDLSLHLIHAPGHAADQLVVYHAESATLWAADMLSDLEPPYLAHSLAAYQRTLARLAELEVRLLVPGHGSPTADAKQIRARLSEDAAYLAELRDRVGRAVRTGKTVQETVALCADVRYRCAEENAGPHRMNVESAYLELGGEVDPTGLGWSRVGDA
jgi:glyoxylase-like metal-dependent hydrolase (beta-lactamase superfamily II)